MVRSQNVHPSGGLKIAKTLIFELFGRFKIPKNFRDKQGGFLIKGGFLNFNTPDDYWFDNEADAPSSSTQSIIRSKVSLDPLE